MSCIQDIKHALALGLLEPKKFFQKSIHFLNSNFFVVLGARGGVDFCSLWFHCRFTLT